jgi:hypothetical protein
MKGGVVPRRGAAVVKETSLVARLAKNKRIIFKTSTGPSSNPNSSARERENE